MLTLRKGEAIAGRTERAGRALPRCWVSAQGPGWQGGVLSDKDGAFTRNGLPPGRYDLKAQEFSTDLKGVREGVATGSTGVVLTLE